MTELFIARRDGAGPDVAEGVIRAYQGEFRICHDPIFVIGAPRSATTGLGWALAKHSHLWTSEETLFILGLFGYGRVALQYRRWAVERTVATWLKAENVDFPEFLGYLGLGLNALFTDRSGGRRWIDHTPDHALMVDELAAMFPGAYFVHILRDGRSVVHSMLHIANTFSEDQKSVMIAGQFLPRWGTDFRAACKAWRDSVQASLAASEKYPSRCVTVVQEKLVANPEDEFARIFDFINVPFEPGPPHYWRSNRINSSFGSAGPDAGPPQDKTGADRWREWSPEQRQIFLEEAGETLVTSGLATQDDLESDSAPELSSTGAETQ